MKTFLLLFSITIGLVISSSSESRAINRKPTETKVRVSDLPVILSATSGTRCGSGTVMLTATSSAGIVNWYATPVGGTLLGTGNTFTTPVVDSTTLFYAEASYGDSISVSRTSVAAIVNPLPSAIINSQSPVSCNGGNDGSATLSVSGGTPSYTYSWFPNGGTALTASMLNAGTYTFTVTDSNQCAASLPVSITEPGALVATTGTIVNVTCYGAGNGSATVNVSGGTGNYYYNWSSGGSAATENYLSGGLYTCTISDDNACTTSATVSITEPSELLFTSSKTPSACGMSNGAASVTPHGGTGAYTYSWFPGNNTTSAISAVVAGNYTCTITDSNTCKAHAHILIPNKSGPTVTLTSANNISCYGLGDGSASVTANGGTTPYSYNWLPKGGHTAVTYSLHAGTYTCQVTDAIGCIGAASTTLTQPSPVQVTLSSTSPGACNGGADTLVASGGVTYSWTPAVNLNTTSAPEVIATLTDGITYTVTATDASGCSGSNTIYLQLNPDQAVPVILDSGSVLISSVTAAQYQWYLNGNPISGANSQRYPVTSVGNYLVTVSNSFGCSASSSVYTFTATGVQMLHATNGIHLYPNPAQNDVTLELDRTGDHTVLYLYDLLGQQIRAMEIINSKTNIVHSDLDEGIYLYRILSDKQLIASGRLVMQR